MLEDLDYRQVLRRSWELRRGALSSRTAEGNEHGAGLLAAPAASTAPSPTPGPRLRQQLYEQLLRDVERQGAAGLKQRGETRARIRQVVDQALAAQAAPALAPRERRLLEEQLASEIDGLGPLDPLFADPTVSDILVNGPYAVWVERFGRLERTHVRFDDEAHLQRLLSRLVAAQGRHLDEASPYVDVRLADGSRLNALIPPLCDGGAVISIRRSRAVPFRFEQLYASGALSREMGALLAAGVSCGLNVVVSGGTGSGKTTLLNALSRHIPSAERVVTIEETAELRLDHPHVVALEAQPPNIEGRGEVSVRSLVRNSLRMRAERLIVGEVRGAEVFDMLQAMNTGHYGSLTTVHANSPQDTLRRLESLVLLSGFDLPSRAIRDLLGAAFDLVVHIMRYADGNRRVTSIQEVLLAGERLETVELFRFEGRKSADTFTGRHVATGARPSFLPRLVDGGYPLEGIFDPPADAEPAERPDE